MLLEEFCIMTDFRGLREGSYDDVFLEDSTDPLLSNDPSSVKGIGNEEKFIHDPDYSLLEDYSPNEVLPVISGVSQELRKLEEVPSEVKDEYDDLFLFAPENSQVYHTVNGFRAYVENLKKANQNKEYVFEVIDGVETLFTKPKVKVPVCIVLPKGYNRAFSIKVSAQFADNASESKYVARCANHLQDSKDEARGRFFMFARDSPNISHSPKSSSELCSMFSGCNRTELIYQCFSTCPSVGKRSVQTVFELYENDQLLDTSTFAVRVCANPCRDLQKIKPTRDPLKESNSNNVKSSDVYRSKRIGLPSGGENMKRNSSVFNLTVVGDETQKKIKKMLCDEARSQRYECQRRERYEDVPNPFRAFSILNRDSATIEWLSLENVDCAQYIKYFEKAGLRTLGDIADQYHTDPINNLKIPKEIKSKLNHLFANWFYVAEYEKLG